MTITVILAAAPVLVPRTWYGMPAYALTALTPDVEAKIAALVKKAVG